MAKRTTPLTVIMVIIITAVKAKLRRTHIQFIAITPQAIANAVNGFNIYGIFNIWLDFPAQITDMAVEGAV